MTVHLFPNRRPTSGGTIHVWGDRAGGFSVSHESHSGDSWGEIHGPYWSGDAAITQAVALNRYYGGNCEMAINAAAVTEANQGVTPASVLEDF